MRIIPNLKEIEDASQRIVKYIYKTPYDYSNFYSDVVESNVYLKHEGLQRTGSFKIRGH